MSFSFPARVAVVAVTASLALAACGSKTETLNGKVVDDALGCKIEQVPQRTDPPTITKVDEIPTKVVTKDIDKGKKQACGVDANTYLTMDMVGAKAKDGSVFTSTFDEKRPITAVLGNNQLLPGLESGLKGMKVGGRRQIVIPAALAYGKDGNEAQGIGPDEPLEFVVDLRGVTATPAYCNANTSIPEGKTPGKPMLVDMPVKAPTKLEIKTLKPGTGAALKKGDGAKVHYLGLGCSTGTQFESSWDSGQPFDVEVGGLGAIRGFSDGLVGIKVGEQRQLNIPADMAYGASGGPTTPNDSLIFVIEVVEKVDASAPQEPSPNDPAAADPSDTAPINPLPDATEPAKTTTTK